MAGAQAAAGEGAGAGEAVPRWLMILTLPRPAVRGGCWIRALPPPGLGVSGGQFSIWARGEVDSAWRKRLKFAKACDAWGTFFAPVYPLRGLVQMWFVLICSQQACGDLGEVASGGRAR